MLGEREQPRPRGDFNGENDRLPAKPPRPVTVTVELPAEPAGIVTVVGLAVTVKSWTEKPTLVEWAKVPLEAVIITV